MTVMATRPSKRVHSRRFYKDSGPRVGERYLPPPYALCTFCFKKRHGAAPKPDVLTTGPCWRCEAAKSEIEASAEIRSEYQGYVDGADESVSLVQEFRREVENQFRTLHQDLANWFDNVSGDDAESRAIALSRYFAEIARLKTNLEKTRVLQREVEESQQTARSLRESLKGTSLESPTARAHALSDSLGLCRRTAAEWALEAEHGPASDAARSQREKKAANLAGSWKKQASRTRSKLGDNKRSE